MWPTTDQEWANDFLGALVCMGTCVFVVFPAFLKPFKAFQSILKPFKDFQSILKAFKSFEDLLNHLKAFQNILRSFKAFFLVPCICGTFFHGIHFYTTTEYRGMQVPIAQQRCRLLFFLSPPLLIFGTHLKVSAHSNQR